MDEMTAAQMRHDAELACRADVLGALDAGLDEPTNKAFHLANDPECCGPVGCRVCPDECRECNGCQRTCECYEHGNIE